MTYSAEVLADSPLAYYRLGETSGATAADSTANARTLTWASTVTGAAGLLSGDADGAASTASNYATRAAESWMDPTGALTVEAWVKPSSLTGSLAGIVDRYGDGNTQRSWLLYSTNGTLTFLLTSSGGADQTVGSASAMTVGTTYHVVGTWDGTTALLYVNGSQVASLAASHRSAPAPLQIGRVRTASGAGQNFNGTIDEVAIYGTALSASRIQAHYSAGTAAPAATPKQIYLGQVILTGTAQPLAIVPTITSEGDTRNRAASLQQLAGTGTSTLTYPVDATPAGIDLGTEMEGAFSLPALTFDANGRPLEVKPSWFEQPAKRFRVLVDGHDVTYFRGERTPVSSYKLTEPYSFGATTLTVPQIHAAYERPGDANSPWARKGARVRYDLVDRETGAVVKAGVYRGVVVSRRAGSSSLEVGGALSGIASLRYRAVPLYRELFDLGRLAWQACKHLGVPLVPRIGPKTGIEVVSNGGQDYLGWLDYLCAMSLKSDGTQRAFKWDEARHAWRFAEKDRATKDFTVWVDGANVVLDLIDDAAEQPTAYYLSGVNSNGRRMKGSVYPGMIQGDTPPYPFNDGRSFGVGTTNADTNTGDGITVMVNRLIGAGYLSLRDDFGAGTADPTFTDDVADAVNDLRDDAGLTQNGQMSTKAWDALYDLSVTGLTMAQAHIQPMVVDPAVKKYTRTSTGAISGRTGSYDPKVLRVDRNVDFGFGVTRQQMRKWARQDMRRSKDAWTGTITLHSDVFAGEYAHGGTNPQVMSKFEIKAGMNAWVPNFDGGTLFHVSYLDADPEAGTVTLTVDTQARDAVDLAAIIQRNREARRNPEAEWIRDHRASRQVIDSVVEWDEYAGFLYNKVTLKGGRWNVFPVISGGEGTVARIRVQTDTPAAYVMAVFGRHVGPRMLMKRVSHPLATHSGVTGLTIQNAGGGYTSAPTITFSGGQGSGAKATATVSGGKITAVTITNPGAGYTSAPSVSLSGGGGSGGSITASISPGSDRWTDQDLQDWLHDERLCVYVAGDAEQPCGYWPKSHTNDRGETTGAPVTGTWQDDAGFGYRTFKTPVLWVAIFPDRDTVLKPQHLMYDQLESGV